MDLRGGDLTESHMTHTIFLQGGPGGAAMDRRTREMGAAFGMRYCRHSRPDVFDTQPGTLIYEALKRGVPSIISEAGTGYDQQPTEQDILAHLTGVTNLLHWAKMLPGPPQPPAGEQLLLAPDFVDVKATVAGIFKHGPDRGELVEKGARVGVVADLDGTVLETLTAPVAAVVHEMMPRRLIYPGDTVYTLAVVDGNLTSTRETE